VLKWALPVAIAYNLLIALKHLDKLFYDAQSQWLPKAGNGLLGAMVANF